MSEQAKGAKGATTMDAPKRKITYVALHTPLVWPSGGNMNTQQNISSGPGKTPGVKFTEEPNGILIEWQGKLCMVPYTAVANWLVE